MKIPEAFPKSFLIKKMGTFEGKNEISPKGKEIKCIKYKIPPKSVQFGMQKQSTGFKNSLQIFFPFPLACSPLPLYSNLLGVGTCLLFYKKLCTSVKGTKH